MFVAAVPDNTVDENEENKENEENEENIEFIDDPDVRQYITETFEPEYVHNDEFEDTGDNEAGRSMHISSLPPDVNATTSKRKGIKALILYTKRSGLLRL